jgi:hypothetical protein
MPVDADKESEFFLKQALKDAYAELEISKTKRLTQEDIASLIPILERVYAEKRAAYEAREGVALPDLLQYRMNINSIPIENRNTVRALSADFERNIRDSHLNRVYRGKNIPNFLKAFRNLEVKHLYNLTKRNRRVPPARRNRIDANLKKAFQAVERAELLGEPIPEDARRRIENAFPPAAPLLPAAARVENEGPLVAAAAAAAEAAAAAPAAAVEAEAPVAEAPAPVAEAPVAAEQHRARLIAAALNPLSRQAARVAAAAAANRPAGAPARSYQEQQQLARVAQEAATAAIEQNRVREAARAAYIEEKRQENLAWNTALQREEERMARRNAAITARQTLRAAERGVRATAEVTRVQELHGEKLGLIRRTTSSIKEATGKIMEKTDDVLRISKDIKAGVDEIKGDVKDLKQWWKTDKTRFFKEMVANEFAMMTIFFCLHPYLPLTAEVLGGFFIRGLQFRRAYVQIKSYMSGRYNVSIINVALSVVPHYCMQVFLQYNTMLIDARLGSDPTYMAAFAPGLSTEQYILSLITAIRTGITDMEQWKRMGRSIRDVELPSLEDVRGMFVRTLEWAGRTYNSELESLARINPNWRDPAKFADVLSQYCFGKAELVINGVTTKLGTRAFAYQLGRMGSANVEVWKIVCRFVVEFLYNGLKSTLSGLWTLLKRGLCMLLSALPLPKMLGGTTYEECMKKSEKDKMAGGGILDAQPMVLTDLQMSFRALELSCAYMMIEALRRPPLFKVYRPTFERVCEAGGSMFELFMEGKMGYTIFPYPLVNKSHSLDLLPAFTPPDRLLIKDEPRNNNTRKRRGLNS